MKNLSNAALANTYYEMLCIADLLEGVTDKLKGLAEKLAPLADRLNPDSEDLEIARRLLKALEEAQTPATDTSMLLTTLARREIRPIVQSRNPDMI